MKISKIGVILTVIAFIIVFILLFNIIGWWSILATPLFMVYACRPISNKGSWLWHKVIEPVCLCGSGNLVEGDGLTIASESMCEIHGYSNSCYGCNKEATTTELCRKHRSKL